MISKLIELIKTKGFLTLSQAAIELGTTNDVIKDLIEYLVRRGHLLKVNLAFQKGCQENMVCGNCAGCSGCVQPAQLQIDGTPVVYKLNPRMMR